MVIPVTIYDRCVEENNFDSLVLVVEMCMSKCVEFTLYRDSWNGFYWSNHVSVTITQCFHLQESKLFINKINLKHRFSG